MGRPYDPVRAMRERLKALEARERANGEVRKTYGGTEINAVLTLVERMTGNGDAQLSILAHALVIACKSTRVDRVTALAEIGKLWDLDDPLVPLRRTE